MLKTTSKLLAVTLLSSSLFGQNFNITNNWQLLGATEDLNISEFNNQCIDYIWKYNSSEWSVHIANGNAYNLPENIEPITSLNKGDGFWVKGNSSCQFSISNDMQSTPNITISDHVIDNMTYTRFDGTVIYNYIYNEDRKILTQNGDSDNDGVVDKIITYLYDDTNGKVLTKYIDEDADGNTDSRYEYDYDLNDILISKKYHYSNSDYNYVSYVPTSFDQFGNTLTERLDEDYDDDGIVDEVSYYIYEYTYDSNNKIITANRFYDDDNDGVTDGKDYEKSFIWITYDNYLSNINNSNDFTLEMISGQTLYPWGSYEQDPYENRLVFNADGSLEAYHTYNTENGEVNEPWGTGSYIVQAGKIITQFGEGTCYEFSLTNQTSDGYEVSTQANLMCSDMDTGALIPAYNVTTFDGSTDQFQILYTSNPNTP